MNRGNMNAPGQLFKRVEDLEGGRDGDKKDLVVSWEDSGPFVVFHMMGSRYVGQSEPHHDQYTSDISTDNNNPDHYAKTPSQS